MTPVEAQAFVWYALKHLTEDQHVGAAREAEAVALRRRRRRKNRRLHSVGGTGLPRRD